MSPEVLFAVAAALIPVAAASGWWAGRSGSGAGSNGRSNGRSNGKGLSAEYFNGLRYLLDEQPDKAIEVFIKAMEVDEETVETHLALGNLFRRRGEMSRAIRIHQNLIARPTLDLEQRTLALRELALDYLRAGLLDRAEGLFTELLDSDAHRTEVLRHLLDIYQQERDWERAIDITLKLERASGRDLRDVRAQILCERAEEALLAKDRHTAARLLEEAADADVGCVRVSLMQARLALQTGDPERAIEWLQRVAKQDLEFAPETLAPLLECYRSVGRLDELTEYLEQLTAMHAGISPVLMLAQLAAERGDIDRATGIILDELRSRPTVRGVNRLIEYSLLRAIGTAAEPLERVQQFTKRLLEGKATYNCYNCGFAGQTLHWQCPSCKRWGTVKPIHGLEGE